MGGESARQKQEREEREAREAREAREREEAEKKERERIHNEKMDQINSFENIFMCNPGLYKTVIDPNPLKKLY